MMRRYEITTETTELVLVERTVVQVQVVAPVFKFWTPSGKYYDVLPNGTIVRLDMPDFVSKRWKFQGIRYKQRKATFYSVSELNVDLIRTLEMKRVSVVDLDCGTTREWCEPIAGFYFYTEKERQAA